MSDIENNITPTVIKFSEGSISADGVPIGDIYGRPNDDMLVDLDKATLLAEPSIWVVPNDEVLLDGQSEPGVVVHAGGDAYGAFGYVPLSEILQPQADDPQEYARIAPIVERMKEDQLLTGIGFEGLWAYASRRARKAVHGAQQQVAEIPGVDPNHVRDIAAHQLRRANGRSGGSDVNYFTPDQLAQQIVEIGQSEPGAH